MRLNLKEVRYLLGATEPGQCPKGQLPEIPIVGRSNVGKSSLINHLLQNRSLARVSSTPGKTRILNFYCIGEQLLLVDLPGYGYAKIPQQEWHQWIAAYFQQRTTIRCVWLLIDSRHPLSSLDQEMLAWLHLHALPVLILLTKSDKSTDADRLARRREIGEGSSQEPLAIIDYSIQNGAGRSKVLQWVQNNL